MIRREWEGDFVLIPQPEHARLSGVLAEHWGAGEFVRPEPWDEVLLATYEHDEGWVEWEKRPTLDADHFLVNFNRTPLEVTIDNFRRTVEKAYKKGRPYAAALVNRHAINVYELVLSLRGLGPEEEAKIHDYVSELEGRQAEIFRELAGQPEFERAMTDEAVHRNGRFVTVLDLLSLILCNGWTHLDRMAGVPMGEDHFGDIGVKWADPGGPDPGGPDPVGPGPVSPIGMCLELTPWPFSRDSLEGSAQGLRIPGHPFDTEEDLHAALREAPPFEMSFRVIPG